MSVEQEDLYKTRKDSIKAIEYVDDSQIARKWAFRDVLEVKRCCELLALTLVSGPRSTSGAI